MGSSLGASMPLLQAHNHLHPGPGGATRSPGRSQRTLAPRVLGRKQLELSPSFGSRWVAPHQPDVESGITPPNYPRIWKLFVPPTFPLARELISPLHPPRAGAWGHRAVCPRKLFLIANYCPLELMVVLNHHTLIWGF